MQYEVLIRQTIDYGVTVEAASFNDAAMLAEKRATEHVKKLGRAVGISCFNDHDTKVTGVFANDSE